MLKDKLKELNFIDYLIFTYIFFLPFIKIGVKVIVYTFSICDVILIIILLRYIYKIIFQKFKFFKINNITKTFIILYIIFFIGISFSVIDVNNLKFAVAELLAYFYGLLIILILSLYILERNKIGLKIIFWGFAVSLIIISLSSLMFFFIPTLKNMFFMYRKKYIFFMRKPNQLAIYLIICFCIFLLGHKKFLKSNTANKILITLFPVLFIITVLMTKSRTGLFITILLILYFYISRIKYLKKEILLFLVIISIIFIFKYRVFFIRPLSVFQSLVKGEYIDKIRVEMFTQGIKAFKNNPVNGVGLGNFRNVWHKNEIHNVPLAILAETGLLGFIPYCILFIWLGITIVFKFTRQILEKSDYIIIFISLFLYKLQHHVLRERWLWVFFIYFLLFSYSKYIRQEK